LNFLQQRFEANFRFGLARAREYSEQIALLKGEENESNAAASKFSDIFDNYMRIVHVRKRLMAFTSTYTRLRSSSPMSSRRPSISWEKSASAD